MMGWEYKVETIPLDHTHPSPNEILDILGLQGWELVGVTSQSENGAIYVILFLKRPTAHSSSEQDGRPEITDLDRLPPLSTKHRKESFPQSQSALMRRGGRDI
jgi:hypothetical protein